MQHVVFCLSECVCAWCVLWMRRFIYSFFIKDRMRFKNALPDQSARSSFSQLCLQWRILFSSNGLKMDGVRMSVVALMGNEWEKMRLKIMGSHQGMCVCAHLECLRLCIRYHSLCARCEIKKFAYSLTKQSMHKMKTKYKERTKKQQQQVHRTIASYQIVVCNISVQQHTSHC